MGQKPLGIQRSRYIVDALPHIPGDQSKNTEVVDVNISPTCAAAGRPRGLARSIKHQRATPVAEQRHSLHSGRILHGLDDRSLADTHTHTHTHTPSRAPTLGGLVAEPSPTSKIASGSHQHTPGTSPDQGTLVRKTVQALRPGRVRKTVQALRPERARKAVQASKPGLDAMMRLRRRRLSNVSRVCVCERVCVCVCVCVCVSVYVKGSSHT